MMGTRYKTNAGNVFSLKYHFVWYPKFSRKVLVGNLAMRSKELLDEKAGQLEVDIEVLENVHLFVAADPTKALQQLANQFKGYTSRVLRRVFAQLRTRASVLWSGSDGVGSVGHVSAEPVRRYIGTQEKRS